MENNEGVIKDLLEENEEIVYRGKVSINIEYPKGRRPGVKLENLYDDTDIYISNFGNFYFYTKKENLLFYFKQLNEIRRFNYYLLDEKVVIEFYRLMCKPTKKNILDQFVFISLKLVMYEKEFNELEKCFKVRLFHKQITEEEEIEVGEDDLLFGNNLYKVYGDNKEEFTALNGINIKVKEGDFICIMGPSGSGKSTLINVLSTIDDVTRGDIIFNGKNILSLPDKEISRFRYENLGFIFQDFNLLDNLTIKENIAIPLILASKTLKEIEERVKSISERLGISSILNKYPSQCSGGQKQRVACCRALVTNPKIIVADEPTGNLDTKNSHELLKLLQELNNDGVTIIMVTHDNMIASYSRKLIFIRDGMVEEVLERENESQKEFFYKIVDITSRDSQNLIDIL